MNANEREWLLKEEVYTVWTYDFISRQTQFLLPAWFAERTAGCDVVIVLMMMWICRNTA